MPEGLLNCVIAVLIIIIGAVLLLLGSLLQVDTFQNRLANLICFAAQQC